VLGRIGGLTPASLHQSVKQLKAQTVVLALFAASDCDITGARPQKASQPITYPVLLIATLN
jgi:hypothetical protein